MPHSERMTPKRIQECENVKRLFQAENLKSGLTQKTLAHMVGKSPKTISAIINKRMPVSIETGRDIAKALGVPLIEILPWTATLGADGDYADIIDDLQELSDENQKAIRRMVRNLLDGQEES